MKHFITRTDSANGAPEKKQISQNKTLIDVQKVEVPSGCREHSQKCQFLSAKISQIHLPRISEIEQEF